MHLCQCYKLWVIHVYISYVINMSLSQLLSLFLLLFANGG